MKHAPDLTRVSTEAANLTQGFGGVTELLLEAEMTPGFSDSSRSTVPPAKWHCHRRRPSCCARFKKSWSLFNQDFVRVSLFVCLFSVIISTCASCPYTKSPALSVSLKVSTIPFSQKGKLERRQGPHPGFPWPEVGVLGWEV